MYIHACRIPINIHTCTYNLSLSLYLSLSLSLYIYIYTSSEIPKLSRCLTISRWVSGLSW